jgi:undecaprenyl-diphosphatase
MYLLPGLDEKIFHLINGAWANPVFNVLMPLITELGTGEVIFLISAICYVLRRKKDKGALAILLFAGLTVSYYAVSFLKSAVGRPRPFVVMPDARFFIIEKSFSFPSAHATQSFMAATILSGFFISWRVPLFIIAALICYSRVYMGVHFLSDVAAGAILGTMIGWAILRVARSAGLMEDRTFQG